MPKLKYTRDFLKWHVFLLVQYQLLRPPPFLAWLFAKTSGKKKLDKGNWKTIILIKFPWCHYKSTQTHGVTYQKYRRNKEAAYGYCKSELRLVWV